MSKKLSELNPTIIDEASNWFVTLNAAEGADTAARTEFNTWLRRSPEHVRAYLEITALWEEAELLGKTRKGSADELLARALAEKNVVPLDSAEHEPARASRKPARRRPLAIAASILMVLAAASAYFYVQRDTYATDIGEQRSIRLADGSTVDLNSRSKLRVRFTDDERDVELLEGQALFRVARDASRPFTVRAGNTSVRALGTQFDVYRKELQTVVTVIEGRVAVAGGEAISDPVPLAAGEQVIATPKAVAPPQPADIQAVTAWTRREIAFRATPLSDVIEEFNRYNTRRLTISDESLGATRISGIFSSSDPDSLLRFLRELPHIRIEEHREEIRISAQD